MGKPPGEHEGHERGDRQPERQHNDRRTRPAHRPEHRGERQHRDRTEAHDEEERTRCFTSLLPKFARCPPHQCHKCNLHPSVSEPVSLCVPTTTLLSLALGDSLGLPHEGLSPRRAARLFPPPHRQRLLISRGMVSDDTEHACMTAQALIASAGDPALFQRDLARRLRWWLAALPAGVGLATARSIITLWIGVPPDKSGVRSAGNGAAMRAPIIGVFARDLAELAALVSASTEITHRDARALHGALAVALAAHHAAHKRDSRGRIDPSAYRADLAAIIPDPASPLLPLIDTALAHLDRPSTDLARTLDLHRRGVTGYILHTAPIALHAALRHAPDVRATISAILPCGGDTDTVAAIAAAISGSAATTDADLPADWLNALRDWPRSTAWMGRLADQLAVVAASRIPQRPITLPPLMILPRNAVFLAIVLGHGFRRLLPPY